MADIKEFPVTITVPVAWGDMDAFGHVNNIMFFKYFESVRIKYFEEIGMIELMKTTDTGPILAETSCKFIRPLLYPDELILGARVRSITEAGFFMDYMIKSKNAGVAATGMGKIVMYDYTDNKKAVVPETLREAIERIEGNS